MPISLPVPGSIEERIEMINGLLGDRPPEYEISEHPCVRRVKGYRLALITGATCGSETVAGGCARYPYHSGGHCTYRLPGDPGYDASPGAAAMVRMRDEALAVVEQLTGETPQDVAESAIARAEQLTDPQSGAALGNAGVPIHELPREWRRAATEEHETGDLLRIHTARILRYCADELDAYIAARSEETNLVNYSSEANPVD